MADLQKMRNRKNKRIVLNNYPNAHVCKIGNMVCIRKGIGLDVRLSGWYFDARSAWTHAAEIILRDPHAQT